MRYHVRQEQTRTTFSVLLTAQGRARSGGSGHYPREGEQASLTDLAQGTRVFVLTALDLAMRSRADVRAARPSGTVQGDRSARSEV